jgi:uncharacterized membrane protein
VRFVNMALTPQEIAETTGVPVDSAMAPVRAFAGLASAPSVDARVDLVMEDLVRLGAFARSVICLASPTGSGYVNYVAAETLEYLTRGDCATVALQYSLRPSFLSMDRVRIGREQNRALLHALEWRLRAMPEDQRPRLVCFGESLGAQTLQDAFLYEGAKGFHRVGIGRALFVGTPATSKWAAQWRLARADCDPGDEIVEVASYDEWVLRTATTATATDTSSSLTMRTRSPGSSRRWQCSGRRGLGPRTNGRRGCRGSRAGTRSRPSS